MKKILVGFIVASMVMLLLAGGFTSISSARAATTYTVTFDSMGGSYTPAPITGIASGATITLPKAPTKAGRTFSGWILLDKNAVIDSHGSKVGSSFSTTTPVTADIKVEATYIVLGSSLEEHAPNSITVTEASSPANSPAFNFTTTGGLLPATFSLKNKTRSFKELAPGVYTITMKKVPGYTTNSLPNDVSGTYYIYDPNYKPGFSQNGLWEKTNSDGSITTTITLISGRSASIFFNNRIIHTVAFDAQGGSPTPAPITVVYGTTVELPKAPTKTGFAFKGWNTKADGTGTTFAATTPVIADVTVYAIYTALPPVFVPGYWYFWNIPGFMKNTTFHFPTSILQWHNSTISFLGGAK